MAALWCNLVFAAYPYTLSAHYGNGDRYMRIRLLGSVEIPTIDIDGIRLTELSALAFDNDANRLYALSDQGTLFHLSPTIEAGILVDVEVLAAFHLLDDTGKRLKGSFADAEGLAAINHDNQINDDTQLLVSFERRPRIISYSTTGTFLQTHPLSETVREKFAGSNRGLEAITVSPTDGILSATEMPQDRNRTTTPIYASKGPVRQFRRHPVANSSLVALEWLADNSLLSLERSYSSIWQPLIIVIRKSQPLSADDTEVHSETIAEFNSYDGWRLDNFEGLTQHTATTFFAVSDDNENALQRTLLIYFEILPGSSTPTTRTD